MFEEEDIRRGVECVRNGFEGIKPRKRNRTFEVRDRLSGARCGKSSRPAIKALRSTPSWRIDRVLMIWQQWTDDFEIIAVFHEAQDKPRGLDL
jgi:hypothetical protein